MTVNGASAVPIVPPLIAETTICGVTKVAVVDAPADARFSVHGLAEQAPENPENTWPLPGVAVSVTLPLAYCVHVPLEQEKIPLSLTVPDPLIVTLSTLPVTVPQMSVMSRPGHCAPLV